MNSLLLLLLLLLLCGAAAMAARPAPSDGFDIAPDFQPDADLVIVTSHYEEDLAWLQKSDYPTVVCSKKLPSPLCPVTANKGFEASSLLAFIVHNYARLPAHVAFLHGHEKAWHQKLDIMKAISCADYKQHGFISLNSNWCSDFMGLTENGCWGRERHLLEAHWDELFRPFLNRDPPPRIITDCCAQFIVSRERILRLPLEAYRTWLSFLMRDSEPKDKLKAIVFESMWAIIFGEPDIRDKDQNTAKFRCDPTLASNT